MILIKQIQDCFVLYYPKTSGADLYQMIKYDLEYYEIGQLMGGN